jgi:hypothetical protein
MKFAKFFIIFSICLLINFTPKSSVNSQELSKSVCQIANDVVSSLNDTQDILIGNFGRKVKSSIVNDILRCIDGATAAVVTDFEVEMTNKNLRKAAIVIVVFDDINGVSMSRNSCCVVSVLIIKYFIEKLTLNISKNGKKISVFYPILLYNPTSK